MEAVAAAASSVAAFMAAALRRARAAQRAREEESRASREASEGALVLPIYAGRGRGRVAGGGTHGSNGGARSAAWSPCGHSAEQAASANERNFGSRFRHVRSIFVLGCLKQICHSLTTLQHFFRCHGLLSSASTSN